MADYLRQLRNDEKRSKFATIGCITADVLKRTGANDGATFVAGDFLRTAEVPGGAYTIRFYAVVAEAFATTSVLTWGFEDAQAMGVPILTALDLTTEDETIALPLTGVGRFEGKTPLGITCNQAAIESNTGKVYLVVEYTEAPVTAGCYAA